MPENQNRDSYNFQSLQEDAIRRAREMQSRARLSSFESPLPAGPGSGQEEPHPHTEQFPIHEPGRPSPPAKPQPASDPGPGPEEPEGKAAESFLDTLLKDNEKTLIWVLLLILLEEKADTALILALMYLAT